MCFFFHQTVLLFPPFPGLSPETKIKGIQDWVEYPPPISKYHHTTSVYPSARLHVCPSAHLQIWSSKLGFQTAFEKPASDPRHGCFVLQCEYVVPSPLPVLGTKRQKRSERGTCVRRSLDGERPEGGEERQRPATHTWRPTWLSTCRRGIMIDAAVMQL